MKSKKQKTQKHKNLKPIKITSLRQSLKEE
jgi:hypothetical protein